MMYEVLQKENSVYLIITYPKQMTVIMDNSDAEKVAKAILAALPKRRPTKVAADGGKAAAQEVNPRSKVAVKPRR